MTRRLGGQAARRLGVFGALLTLSAPVATQSVAITGGTVYTVSGETIANGTVVITDGRIASVGAGVTIPAGAERIDATGKWVTPGLIIVGSQIGLVEIGAVAETREGSFADSDVSASFNPLDGLNPASQLIPVARTDGITTALLAPSGGLISGQAVVVDLMGDVVEDLLVRSPAGVIANIRASGSGGGSRAGVTARLRQLLTDAREYDRRRNDYRRGEMQELAGSAADLEALLPLLRREQPLFVTAGRRSDIETALRLAREYRLDLVLVGAEEGWQIAARLADAGVTVVVDPLANIPRYSAPSPRLDNAAILAAAGVRVVLSNFDSHNARNLRQAAGNAVANGMTWDAALRAVTLQAAEVAGIADRYGSLEAGKVANLVVWTADPFDFEAAAEMVFIRGARVPMTSRQQELLERYRSLPPRY